MFTTEPLFTNLLKIWWMSTDLIPFSEIFFQNREINPMMISH